MTRVTATSVLEAAFLHPYRSESVPIEVSRERNGGSSPVTLRFCIRAARKPCPFSIHRITTAGKRALPRSWGPHCSAISSYSQASFFPPCAYPPGMRHGSARLPHDARAAAGEHAHAALLRAAARCPCCRRRTRACCTAARSRGPWCARCRSCCRRARACCTATSAM